MAKQKMGWGNSFGLNDGCFKRKYRWLFFIPEISAEGVNALPPSKAARPEVSFKELSLEHLTETIYYPGKPEWKPIQLTLFDIVKKENPILTWLASLYDVENESQYKYAVGFKKSQAILELYDGGGDVLEKWTFDSIWPTTIAWGDLDMSSQDICTVDLTLRYDRAYKS